MGSQPASEGPTGVLDRLTAPGSNVFGDRRLDDPAVLTGLCVVAKRADTRSTWPVSNHPRGQYFSHNRGMKLRDLVYASAAAPFVFLPTAEDGGKIKRYLASIGHDKMKSIGLDPYRQTTHLIYRLLHRISGSARARYPTPTPEEQRIFVNAYGRVPDEMQSDGFVPTRSQIWGDLLYAGRGDHLDVCGHFDDVEHDPPHYDWLASGSAFDRQQFEALWGAVADFILTPASQLESEGFAA